MKQFIFTVLLTWPIFISVPTHAQGTLYKWTDARGNIHYTNTPTSVDAKAVDDVLPPAANFISPAKPTVAAKVTPQSNPDTKGRPSSEEGEPSSTESPDESSSAPTDQEQTGEAPSPVPPQPASTEQQPLTPAQQALKDSPAPMD